ncbi:hypothetical protein L4D20_00155 [Vibrio kyushuensis]|uniref:hypothetical protein n=1 Tax=Vibrio kyushuensis TaxID=2910249 RepID=UPI003D13D714
MNHKESARDTEITIEPLLSQVDGSKKQSMKQTLTEDISAAIELYDSHLKPGCIKLLELNKATLAAERKQARKQKLYRLSWITSLSLLVILVSHFATGINIFTVVGLIFSYFVGSLLHHKFSPEIELPKEREELFTLNNKLRQEALAVENKQSGCLHRLLVAAGLDDDIKNSGLVDEEGKITAYQLDGNGLYQYLDAMNLLMEDRDNLNRLSQTNTSLC